MKKIAFWIGLMGAIFGENLTLDNQSDYPAKTEKMAVQWAHSGQEVDMGNSAIVQGTKLDGTRLQALTQVGKIHLSIPKSAQYFRVLMWTKGGEKPDFLTNWVEVVPNKSYLLKREHLVPAVLMLGTGC